MPAASSAVSLHNTCQHGAAMHAMFACPLGHGRAGQVVCLHRRAPVQLHLSLLLARCPKERKLHASPVQSLTPNGAHHHSLGWPLKACGLCRHLGRAGQGASVPASIGPVAETLAGEGWARCEQQHGEDRI